MDEPRTPALEEAAPGAVTEGMDAIAAPAGAAAGAVFCGCTGRFGAFAFDIGGAGGIVIFIAVLIGPFVIGAHWGRVRRRFGRFDADDVFT